MNLLKDAMMAVEHRLGVLYSWRKLFANFAFLWRFAKVFSSKIYFQAIILDTVLVGVVH